MKRDKQAAPKFLLEYKLLIRPKYKEIERKTVIEFGLRTVNEFTNFKYEINVEQEQTDKTLKLIIRGLRAPKTSIPSIGPAVFFSEYENLSGNYSVIISKHGKEENKFSVDIAEKAITVKRRPTKKFIDITTDEATW
jgi:hypothetical protein